MAKALSGGAAPYLAEVIHSQTISAQGEVNTAANLMAHAVVNTALSLATGENAWVGASSAVTAEAVAMLSQAYYGKNAAELNESQKQTISALASLAAGLAGGLVGGDTASAVAGAQTGKVTVENNLLGSTSSDKLDKAIEKIKQGNTSLATVSELLALENADARSDALVSKFSKDPSQMNSTERAELAGYLRVYAAEIEKEYGRPVAQELIKGLLSGQDYLKRNPDSEVMSKSQSILNTWGYHKSNASIGDAPLMFGSSVLGNTIKEGMALNAAIGAGVNAGVQLTSNDPFSYVDLIMSGITSAATTGKSILPSAVINMGGAAIGSGIKGEDPINSVIGTGFGSLGGNGTGAIISGALGSSVKAGTSEAISAIGGSLAGEAVGNIVKGTLDETEKTNRK